jgi:hypothetical protein
MTRWKMFLASCFAVICPRYAAYPLELVALELCKFNQDRTRFEELDDFRNYSPFVAVNPQTISAIIEHETLKGKTCSLLRFTSGRSILVFGSLDELKRKLGK